MAVTPLGCDAVEPVLCRFLFTVTSSSQDSFWLRGGPNKYLLSFHVFSLPVCIVSRGAGYGIVLAVLFRIHCLRIHPEFALIHSFIYWFTKNLTHIFILSYSLDVTVNLAVHMDVILRAASGDHQGEPGTWAFWLLKLNYRVAEICEPTKLVIVDKGCPPPPPGDNQSS